MNKPVSVADRPDAHRPGKKRRKWSAKRRAKAMAARARHNLKGAR